MSTVKVNAITDASGGNTATINSMTPTADSLQGFRNRIINGAMVIDQRNAGASVTPNNSFTLDRWNVINSQTSKFTVQQNAGSVTPPTGFSSYLGVTSSSAYSVITSDYFAIYQSIEGFNTADLVFGTASAATFTLSFWVRSSLTGTFGGAIKNSAANRSYPFTYTISAANTWEQKTVTIAGDTTGTWVGATNGVGLIVQFGLGAGATFSGTAGSWAASNLVTATGATSVVGTNGATWYITGVQLEVGSVATPFERRDYGRELMLCQRYFQRIGFGTGNGVAGIAVRETANTAGIGFALPVALRSNPTMTVSGANRVWGAGGIITLASSIGSVSSNDSQTITNVYFTQTATGIVASEPYLLYIDAGNSYSLSAEL